MAKILKPRRGTANTMNGAKANTVLAAGEIFFEIPNSGVGSDKGKIKMGDGVTPYGSLPYFLEPAGDISSEEITVTADVSTSSASALANITSNKSVGSLIGSLKQAITLVKSETTSELNKLGTNSSDKLQFPIVRSGAEYGYKNSDGVFSPFRKDSTETYRFSSGSGSTVDMGARNDYRFVNAENVYSAGYSAGVSDGTTEHNMTFEVTTRQRDIDMGTHHAYRYVNSTNVPNENDQTYTYNKTDNAVQDFGIDNRIKKVDASNMVKNGKASAYERTLLWELTSLKESSSYGYFETSTIVLKDNIIGQSNRVADDPGKYRRTQTSNGKTTDYNVGTLLNYDILEIYVSVGDPVSSAVHLSRIAEIKNMFSNGIENIKVPNVKNSLSGGSMVTTGTGYASSYSAYCHVNYIDARRLSGMNFDGKSANSFDVANGGSINGENQRVGLYPEILHAGGFNSLSDTSLSIYCRILGMVPGSGTSLKIGKCTTLRGSTSYNRNCIPYLIYGVKFKYYKGDERDRWNQYKNDSTNYTYALI